MENQIAIIVIIFLLALWTAYNIWVASGRRWFSQEKYIMARNYARDVVSWVRQVYGAPTPNGEFSGDALKQKAVERLLEIMPAEIWGVPEARVAAAADTIIEAALFWLKNELVQQSVG